MLSICGHETRTLPVGLLLLVVGCMGCSSEMSEQTLAGRWGATDKSGVASAIKIKSGSPDSKGSDIVAAAKILAATSLELKKDGEFSLQFGVNKYDGSWKFDQAEAMVDLTVAKMNGEVVDVKNLLTGSFLGVMNRDDWTMRLYPIDRKGYQEFKRRGDKGPEAMSVRLQKGA
jgi:hypothetical protein